MAATSILAAFVTVSVTKEVNTGQFLTSRDVRRLRGRRGICRLVQHVLNENGMPGKSSRTSEFSCFKASGSSEISEEQKKLCLDDFKKILIKAVANTNRGKNTTPEERKRIFEMIMELENLNPAENPVNSPYLSGYWSLLYTAPVDEIKSDKYAGTQEGPFLARVKPLAFGSVRQTRSSQVIDVERGIAKNIADFTFLGRNGTLTIQGKASPSQVVGKERVRLDVTFDSFSVKIGDWTFPTISLQWINPQGWVDTTFLDQDMRVGRGDKGSVFVSVRAKK
ncbi:hypothetical protein KP509_01G011500 [Ceratopteris richardii]|uniref:Plastid lipid-associated protein/fibrillin conserved domain-containing protein n=2 Tax=Ceratopteris richardii TaxID=49495 RepID=A0A8T2VDR5_CERRI|nr:hypothetical protein KP509_01G011500 [Ceratopteris richardii]